jgi:hypothetical protein
MGKRMKKNTHKIPERVLHAPSWLWDKEAASPEQISQDMISFAFWNMVDEMVRKEAAKIENGQELVSVIEKRIIETIGADMYMRSRMLAESMDLIFDKSVALQDAMQRVQSSVLMRIKENGFLGYLEFDSVADYLADKKLQHWDGEGKEPPIVGELSFMADYLIPVLEANGFPRRLIFEVSENYHKARYAIKHLRQLLYQQIERTNEIRTAISQTSDEEELEQLEKSLERALTVPKQTYKVLEALVQEMATTKKEGGMSNREFRNYIKRITSGAEEPGTKTLPTPAYIYNTPNGAIVMMEVESVSRLNAIKNLLGALMDWHQASPEDLAREIGVMLVKKEVT